MASAKTKTKPYEARLLRLAAWILSSDTPVPRGAIYRKLGYGGTPEAQERMFTRDKDALKCLGLVIDTIEIGGTEQWGYTIDPHASMLHPFDLSADEAAAAWTAGVSALRLSTHPMRDELEAALRKLVVGARGLPPRAAAIEELGAEGADSDGERHLGKLAEAWEKRRRVHIEYWRAATGQTVERDVDVFGWARRRGEWIFVGYCHLRKGVRIFYLSRVRDLKLAARDPERVRRRLDGDYDIPAGFDIQAWSRQQIWDYDVHAPVEATVRLRGSLAGIAGNLVPGADLSRDGEGGKIARIQVRNLRGLVRQALAWGPEAEVTAPPEARAMARDILADAAPSPSGGHP
jgi:proteasome accessory factor B